MLVGLSAPLYARQNARQNRPLPIENKDVSVKRIIDGDTIVLQGGRLVRLIGIDAPEINTRFGPRARAFLKELIRGKSVRLVFDVNKTDRHGRALAYVYKNDVFVNEQIVLNGFARAMAIPPNIAHAETFRAAEQVARTESRGVWSTPRRTLRPVRPLPVVPILIK